MVSVEKTPQTSVVMLCPCTCYGDQGRRFGTLWIQSRDRSKTKSDLQAVFGFGEGSSM